MPRYTVDVKLFLSVEVEADCEDLARERAENWISWLSPTDEQLNDYLSDHPGVISGGTFDVDGTSEVERSDE